MSHEANHRSVSPPVFWAKDRQDEFDRKMADSIRGVLLGHTNNHYTVTLDAGEVCVEINYPSARPGVGVQITPQSSLASTYQRENNVWGEAENGKVKVCYDGSPAGTEIYAVAVIG
jgi:hypothetical protein